MTIFAAPIVSSFDLIQVRRSRNGVVLYRRRNRAMKCETLRKPHSIVSSRTLIFVDVMSVYAIFSRCDTNQLCGEVLYRERKRRLKVETDIQLASAISSIVVSFSNPDIMAW